jgi:hypothetical protein
LGKRGGNGRLTGNGFYGRERVGVALAKEESDGVCCSCGWRPGNVEGSADFDDGGSEKVEWVLGGDQGGQNREEGKCGELHPDSFLSLLPSLLFSSKDDSLLISI